MVRKSNAKLNQQVCAVGVYAINGDLFATKG